MPTFADYYRDLAQWEGHTESALISPWNPEDVQMISDDFAQAFRHDQFQVELLTIAAGASNQSIGNKVADYFVARINPRLQNFLVESCAGPGYPDKILRRRSTGQPFALELKAPSEFDRNDSNRIVLTSSSQKLRKTFRQPIFHLLGTACYELIGETIRIQTLRLDFLAPETSVNVRLEASVSQRSLARATHQSICVACR